MGRTQAEEHCTAGPRLVGHPATGTEDVSAVDRDVSGAVGRSDRRMIAPGVR